jgi:phosphoglycolate phosphatase-like HAD superfamily hydrolase
MKNKLIILTGFIFLVISVPAWAADPLPSWNKGASKSAIIEFVQAVTDKSNPKFVPVADRIATFDNDGTLWNEKPMYIHFEGVIDRMKAQVKENPALALKEPYMSLLQKKYDYFVGLVESEQYEALVGKLMGVPYAGMTPEEFKQWNLDYYATWKHPKYNVGMENLIYQPMVELIKYLQANDFNVYICTADENAFLQPFSEKLYGIPPENVMGTQVKLEYVYDGKNSEVVRTGEGQYLNNWDGKPRQIQTVTGKKTILAGGNSNGDYHMLEWAQMNGGLALLLYHTDGEREDKYVKHTELVIPMMKRTGGTIIDMKNDWKTVFPAK